MLCTMPCIFFSIQPPFSLTPSTPVSLQFCLHVSPSSPPSPRWGLLYIHIATTLLLMYTYLSPRFSHERPLPWRQHLLFFSLIASTSTLRSSITNSMIMTFSPPSPGVMALAPVPGKPFLVNLNIEADARYVYKQRCQKKVDFILGESQRHWGPVLSTYFLRLECTSLWQAINEVCIPYLFFANALFF